MTQADQANTSDMQQILEALKAYKSGDFTVRLPTGKPGVAGEIAETFNALAAQSTDFAAEMTRVVRELGSIGKLGGQMEVNGLHGRWQALMIEVNFTAYLLTDYVRDMAHSMHNTATNRSSRLMTVQVHGEMDELKQAVNQVVKKSGG
jgi:methyl-accepting chemotaxis protein